MVRIIITGGLLLATIGLAVNMLSGVWGAILVLIGLLAIAVGVLTDRYRYSNKKERKMTPEAIEYLLMTLGGLSFICFLVYLLTRRHQ